MESKTTTKYDFKKSFEKTQSKLKETFLKITDRNTYVKAIDFGELLFYLDDPDYVIVKQIMDSHIKVENEEYLYSNIDKRISRAIACLVCSGIGDALGTHTEFMHVNYDLKELIITGFDKKLQKHFNRCNLGEFSDDTSMALCLADAIFSNNYSFNGADLMIKFINWWEASYNNCLEPRRHSFGLGGNIGTSFDNFIRTAGSIDDLESNWDSLPQFCNYADKNANGNGSVMRNGPVPIAFASNPKLFEYGKDYAYKQSKVTHTGDEAAEACRLLTHLTMKNISRDQDSDIDIKTHIDNALEDFTSTDYSITCLKNSQMEDEEYFKKRMQEGKYQIKFSKSVEDRNWNWKDPNFRYSPTRAIAMPGYIGSYSLDALAMALHISYHSKNAHEAILKASNMGGDCDSVGAVTGQIVGSFYGLEENILALYDGMKPYEKYKLSYIAYKLYTDEKTI
jgi:ADP-ribosyl-[dinitrogen reductase] hydrolase